MFSQPGTMDPPAPHMSREELAAYHLAALIESAEDAIISKDLNGIVTSWNRAAELIFGYTPEEMIGKPILRLIPPELSWQEESILARIRAGQHIRHYEAQRITKYGRRITVALTVSPIRNAQGTIVGASKIARDITEQKEMEQRVETAKDEFLSNVSHELRTPLTGIRAALRLLEHQGVGDRGNQTTSLLRIANANAERLHRLVNELLDFERLSSGVVSQLQPCSLAEIVTPALEAVMPTAVTAGIQLREAVSPKLACLVLNADAERLQQVLLNLLSNALKFSPQGSTIELSATCEQGSLFLRVCDEGEGVPAECLDSIFERFRQADTSDARKGGVGLGLAICRKIVEQHAGAIWAERNDRHAPGVPGTTFLLRLPLPAQPQLAATPRHTG